MCDWVKLGGAAGYVRSVGGGKLDVGILYMDRAIHLAKKIHRMIMVPRLKV